MTYIIIPDQGNPLNEQPHTPTYEHLVDNLDDLPTHITLPDTNDQPTGPLAAWVGDDFIAREERGEVHRNIKATVLLWALGAPRQPYAGNVVITGVRMNMLEGRQPTNLNNDALTLIRTLLYDIDMVLAGNPDPNTPDSLRTQFDADAKIAADMTYEQLTVWTFND